MKRLALLVMLVGLSSSSCFAVTDLDRFKKPEQVSSNFSDLKLTVRGMTSHVAELFEYRIVDNSNVIQSRGFIVPLGGPDASLFVRGAVPKLNGPFRLDFYADHDNNLAYDVDPRLTKDHAWRLQLQDNQLNDDNQFVIVFDHNTSFSFLSDPAPPVEIGKPAVIRMKNMGGFIGKRVEARVADSSSKRVVALFRVPVTDKADFDMTVPGMIETGVTYTVEVYTDDGRSTPASVQAFRVEKAADQNGLDLVFDPQGAGVTPVNAADVVSP